MTAYIQSHSDGIRVIAGSTSGGASLVVKPDITGVEQLRGKKLATPQLGNTQDIALRYWLKDHGLNATQDGGGDVSIQPQQNSAAVQAFTAGSIDGAWVPEPFATRLVKAGGTVLVDEKSLWPDGKFVTTNVIARTAFVQQHPDAVRAFIEAHLDALDEIKADPDGRAGRPRLPRSRRSPSRSIPADVLKASWANLEFTADPLASTLKTSADHAAAVGLLPDKPSDGFAKLWDVDRTERGAGRPEPAEGHHVTRLLDRCRARPSPNGDGCACRASARSSAAAMHQVVALDGVDLDIAPGEFVAVVGGSGCGKSTMLSLAAGLEQPTTGTITANGGVALMFQESTLLPWLTAAQNVELALRLRGVGKAERAPAGPRAARKGAAGPPRRPASARAVRRHAPAGGPRPGARPGVGDRADGRAARRAGRHDPRPDARPDRVGVAGGRVHRASSSPTTCARRSGSPTARS